MWERDAGYARKLFAVVNTIFLCSSVSLLIGTLAVPARLSISPFAFSQRSKVRIANPKTSQDFCRRAPDIDASLMRAMAWLRSTVEINRPRCPPKFGLPFF